ncbi:hypothetical protein AAVH_37248, partial [Aphelenchoides avenae]
QDGGGGVNAIDDDIQIVFEGKSEAARDEHNEQDPQEDVEDDQDEETSSNDSYGGYDDFDEKELAEIATCSLKLNDATNKFVVTRPGTNECLVLNPASQWCETEVLERIFIQWGIGMGSIAADYEDLTTPYVEKKRLDNIKMEEPLLISQVPVQPVGVMISSKPEADWAMDICLWWTIYQLKDEIAKKFGPPVAQQSLFLQKEQLEDEAGVASYSINIGTTIELIIFECGKAVTATENLFKDPNFFAQEYNVDFTKMVDDQKQLTRGGRPYLRPFGCFRYGIKVQGKYPDDLWLGAPGARDYSTKGEWPVAYHGTRELSAASILQEGFKLEKCVAFAYGKGIYCSPDPRTALAYSLSKGGFEFQGKKYLLVIQIRVDPEKLKVVKPSHGYGNGEYWLMPTGDDIRAYGVCVFPYPENGRIV